MHFFVSQATYFSHMKTYAYSYMQNMKENYQFTAKIWGENIIRGKNNKNIFV